MNKPLLTATLTLALTAAASAAALADWGDHAMWADFHGDKTSAFGLGLGGNVTGDFWVAGHADALGQADPSVSVDGVYVVPHKLLFMEVYGGAGLDYAMGSADLGGHIVAGSQFAWFFTEVEYRLVDRGTLVRAGVRLHF